MYVYQYGLLFPFLLALLSLIGEFHTGGVFLDVIPFERLVFTWGYDGWSNTLDNLLTLLRDQK